MRTYTSCFANLRNIPDSVIPVSIARFPPRWFRGAAEPSLAPSPRLLGKAKQGRLTEDAYTAQYLAEIESRYDPAALLARLEEKYGGRDVALLCFEAAGRFCHRRVLARWIGEALGLAVTEL